MASDDTKVSRRGLLALLGLGGAAAVVASKAQAAPSVPAEALPAADKPWRIARVPRDTTATERQDLLRTLQAMGHENVAVVDEGVYLIDHPTGHFGTIESVNDDGSAWVRIGGGERPPALRLDGDGLRVDGRRVEPTTLLCRPGQEKRARECLAHEDAYQASLDWRTRMRQRAVEYEDSLYVSNGSGPWMADSKPLFADASTNDVAKRISEYFDRAAPAYNRAMLERFPGLGGYDAGDEDEDEE